MIKYRVSVDWASEDDDGTSDYGTRNTMEEAKELFQTARKKEKEIAETNGYKIDVDDETSFECGLPGDYAHGHAKLFIEEVHEDDPEEMIVEVCPHCDNEIYMRWSIEEDGYVAYCPYCGDTLLLCDECFHRDGNDGNGPCDFDGDKCGCYRCPEGRVLPSRKAELLDNAIAHLTELTGRSEILNTLRCIGFTDYEIKMLLEVEKDD